MASMQIQGSPKEVPMEDGHEKGYLLGVVSASCAAVGGASDVPGRNCEKDTEMKSDTPKPRKSCSHAHGSAVSMSEP